MDNLEIDLMPVCIKKQMRTIKKVGLCTEIGVFALLTVLSVAGFFQNWLTGVIFSLVLLSITTPLLVPGFFFEKVSQSTVSFTNDQIHIFDRYGRCWRSIDYSSITAVRIEEIAGFFYGNNQELYRNKYICVFLNASTNVPKVSFANLFTHKDFIMFGYHEEAWNCICQKQIRSRAQNMLWEMGEF